MIEVSVPGEFFRVEDLKRVVVSPGDRFVIKTGEYISADMAKRIREVFSEFLGAPVIVLDGGMEIGVVGTV